MKKNISTLIFMAVLACACNMAQENPNVGIKSDHYISFGNVSVDPTITKAASAISIMEPETLLDDSNFTLSGSVSVEPIGVESETKAVGDVIAVNNEITRNNLGGFTVEGFADGKGQFITHAPTTKVAGMTTTNRDIADRWVFTPNEKEFPWYNGLNHIFWAYYSNGTSKISNVSVTEGALKFDFDTDNMSKDCVVAYHEQMWNAQHTIEKGESTAPHDPEDELRILPFKHAVSAVGLENGIVFKRLIKDAKPGPDGKYADNDLGDNVKSAKDATPRLVLNYAGLKCFSQGKATANPNGTFTWAVTGEPIKGQTTPIGSTSNYFVIPQTVNNSDAAGEGHNAVAIFTIRDNRLTKTQDFAIHMPRFTSGTGNEDWVAGNYYKYIFNGRFIAPFIPDDQPDGYPANFAGQGDQINVPFEPMNFDYVNHIRLTWKNSGKCNSNGYHIYMIATKREIKFTSEKWKDGTPINKINDGQTLVNYDTDVVFYEEYQKNDVSWFIEHKCGNDYSFTIDGKPANYGVNGNQPSSDKTYTSKTMTFVVNNIDVTSLEGKTNIYIIYEGGNNANSGWILENISLEIID